jgi:uncharacterized damage-inducible protein DinB
VAEKNHFLTLFGYNYDANARLMQAAAKLDVDAYYAEDSYSHGSLHGLLFHLLRTENVWRMILQTGQGPNPPLAREDFPDLPSLEGRWQLEQTVMLTYINSLNDDDLDGDMEATDWRGMVHKMKRWYILQHIILRRVSHRRRHADRLFSR